MVYAHLTDSVIKGELEYHGLCLLIWRIFSCKTNKMVVVAEIVVFFLIVSKYLALSNLVLDLFVKI